MKKITPSKTIIFIILSFIAATTLYPLFFMFLNTLKDTYSYFEDPFGLPSVFSLENYFLIFNQFNILQYCFNSFFVAICSIVICISLSILAAVIFAKFKFKGKTLFYTFLMSLMMIPGQVMIIPTYLMYSQMGIINTHLSVILAYSVGTIPFSVFMMTSGFKGVPNELLESVQLDGASFFTMVVKIMVPVARASIITVIIFNFVSHWNELLVSMLYLQNDELKTVTAAVATIVRTKGASDYTFFITGLFIASVPPIVIYIFFQKHIINGMVVGAIK